MGKIKKMRMRCIAAVLAIIMSLCFSSCTDIQSALSNIMNPTESASTSQNEQTKSGEKSPDKRYGDKSQVHFVDCGQGDCEIILSNGAVTVIDTGTRKSAQRVLEYIKSLGVSKIDNLVLTHPHEDHIGGAATLIRALSIGTIYMSRPTKGTEPTTAVYIDTLTAISDKGLKITTAKAGMEFSAGDFKMKILSPQKDYEDLNDQSVVIRAEYDKVSFLFTGDAESEPCNDMIKNYRSELDCTVLKVGHHGSKTSTSVKFLEAVSPQYSVISCGEGNSYGHPHGAVLKRLEKSGTKIYRTDIQGSVVMKTNGKSIDVNIEKASG